MKMTRTKRQKWQWERCFNNKGSLTAVTTVLRSIASHTSTLPQESADLREISSKLKIMTEVWNDERLKNLSWEKYKRKEGL